MKFKYEIKGLDCPNCAAKLADIIAGKDGIESAKINFLTERLTISSELPEGEVLALARAAANAFEDGITIE